MAYRMKKTPKETADEKKRQMRKKEQNRKKQSKAGVAAYNKLKKQQAARNEQRGYRRGTELYSKEVANEARSGWEGNVNKFLNTLGDNIGDAIRSGSSAIGMESDFDKGAMKARKEIKGRKSGGYMKNKKGGGKVYKTVALKEGKSISKAMDEDYTKMPKEDMGPVIDSANRIAEMEAKAAKAMKKKKKVKKKMGGGQVYKRGNGGKVIKNNMSGQDLVNACYDN